MLEVAVELGIAEVSFVNRRYRVTAAGPYQSIDSQYLIKAGLADCRLKADLETPRYFFFRIIFEVRNPGDEFA